MTDTEVRLELTQIVSPGLSRNAALHRIVRRFRTGVVRILLRYIIRLVSLMYHH